MTLLDPADFDPFEVLGLTPGDATPESVRQAYWAQARRSDPNPTGESQIALNRARSQLTTADDIRHWRTLIERRTTTGPPSTEPESDDGTPAAASKRAEGERAEAQRRAEARRQAARERAAVVERTRMEDERRGAQQRRADVEAQAVPGRATQPWPGPAVWPDATSAPPEAPAGNTRNDPPAFAWNWPAPPPPPPHRASPPPSVNRWSVAALVSLLVFPIGGPVAVVTGYIARYRIRRAGFVQPGYRRAGAAVKLGYVCTGILVLIGLVALNPPERANQAIDSCADVRQRFPHGVARTAAVARSLDVPKAQRPASTRAAVRVYRAARHLDRDDDGIACHR